MIIAAGRRVGAAGQKRGLARKCVLAGAGRDNMAGGEGGIRTLGTRKGTTVFETAPFDRSGTSPLQWQTPFDEAGR